MDFNDRAQLVSPFTESVDDLQNRLMYVGARGLTALYDGVYLGLSQMRSAHNTKKALLIISDGGDNHSRYTETEIRSLCGKQMYRFMRSDCSNRMAVRLRKSAAGLYFCRT